MTHDTPIDTPAVGSIIEAPDLGPLDALTPRARQVETLEEAYGVWSELIASRAALSARSRDERKRLESQGSLLLGALRVAGAGDGLVKQDARLVDAQSKLDATLVSLEQQASAADARFVTAIAQVRAQLLERVARQAKVARPRFELAVRELAADRRILHLRRINGDAAVLALFVLTGRIPSRYAAITDDSTDDLSASIAAFYADEGITDFNPTSEALVAQLASRADVWPVKGMLPVELGPGRWMRWIIRGAVFEAELLDAGRFRNVLSREEAEQIAGSLLRHQLDGTIELELVRD